MPTSPDIKPGGGSTSPDVNNEHPKGIDEWFSQVIGEAFRRGPLAIINPKQDEYLPSSDSKDLRLQRLIPYMSLDRLNNEHINPAALTYSPDYIKNPRYQAALLLLQSEPEIFGVAATVNPDNHKQSIVYQAAARAVLDCHRENPTLLEEWFETQKEKVVGSALSSLDTIKRLDKELVRRKVISAKDKIADFKSDDERRDVWKVRIDQISEALDKKELTSTQIDFLNILSLSVNIQETIKKLKESYGETDNPNPGPNSPDIEALKNKMIDKRHVYLEALKAQYPPQEEKKSTFSAIKGFFVNVLPIREAKEAIFDRGKKKKIKNTKQEFLESQDEYLANQASKAVELLPDFSTMTNEVFRQHFAQRYTETLLLLLNERANLEAEIMEKGSRRYIDTHKKIWTSLKRGLILAAGFAVLGTVAPISLPVVGMSAWALVRTALGVKANEPIFHKLEDSIIHKINPNQKLSEENADKLGKETGESVFQRFSPTKRFAKKSEYRNRKLERLGGIQEARSRYGVQDPMSAVEVLQESVKKDKFERYGERGAATSKSTWKEMLDDLRRERLDLQDYYNKSENLATDIRWRVGRWLFAGALIIGEGWMFEHAFEYIRDRIIEVGNGINKFINPSAEQPFVLPKPTAVTTPSSASGASSPAAAASSVQPTNLDHTSAFLDPNNSNIIHPGTDSSISIPVVDGSSILTHPADVIFADGHHQTLNVINDTRGVIQQQFHFRPYTFSNPDLEVAANLAAHPLNSIPLDASQYSSGVGFAQAQVATAHEYFLQGTDQFDPKLPPLSFDPNQFFPEPMITHQVEATDWLQGVMNSDVITNFGDPSELIKHSTIQELGSSISDQTKIITSIY